MRRVFRYYFEQALIGQKNRWKATEILFLTVRRHRRVNIFIKLTQGFVGIVRLFGKKVVLLRWKTKKQVK